VCSLAGLVTGISALAGIILGHLALNQIKQTGEEGRSLAIAGLAVGYALVALGIVVIAGLIAFAIFGAWVSTVEPTTTF
jgi:hypothetical protein